MEDGAGRTIRGAVGAVRDYYGAGAIPGLNRNSEKRELDNYKSNNKNIQSAMDCFRKNHGREATNKELEQEMEDRFNLAKVGMNNDEIDKALKSYQEEKAQLEAAGVSNAAEVAADRAKYDSSLSKRYSADKFTDPKKMEQIFNNTKSELMKATGCSESTADKIARERLTRAAKMNGVSKNAIELPPKQIELPPEVVERNNAIERLNSRGVDKPTDGEITQEITLHQDLIDNGFSEAEISEIGNLSNGEGNDGYANRVKLAINLQLDYQNGNSNADNLTQILGKSADSNDVRTEIIEQMKVEKMGVKEDKIADIRRFEIEHAKGDTQKIEKARQFGKKAIDNGGKLSDKDRLENSADLNALAELYAENQKK